MQPNRRKKFLSRLGIMLILMSIISFIVFYLIVMLSNKQYTYINPDEMVLVQTQEIEEGAPTAIINTTYGEIRAVLYPEYAPKTVENFISLAKSGYYDDTYVFEQKQDVYFAAGSPMATGALDDAKETDEHILRETHQNLWPFRGALCAMTTSIEGGFFNRLMGSTKSYSGSRFLFVNSVDFNEAFVTELREASANEALADAFVKMGGVPNFSQQIAIFGQAYAGLDVIETIATVEVNLETNMNGYTPPVDECKILSVTISEYGAEDAEMNELP